MTADAGISEILKGRRTLAAKSLNRFRKVDTITSEIVGTPERLDFRDRGFVKIAKGGFGKTGQREMFRMGGKYPLLHSMMTGIGTVLWPIRDGEVYPTKAPLPSDPAILSNHIKSLGYFLKADFVGVCELPQWALYSHDQEGNAIECTHKYAIVLISEWDYETMSASSGHDWISNCESFLTYHHSGHMACVMASYIRRLGYPARANFQSGGMAAYDMAVSPLVALAGLGEISRASWALNPVIGGRFKAAVVTTDLPLRPDKPIDFGLQSFCKTCKKCARECPSRSISDSDTTVEHNGYMWWEVDMDRCTKYRVMNQNGCGCGRCVKVCPWNKAPGLMHDVVRWAIRKTPAANPMWVRFDDLLGYGKEDRRYKWWFDLEECKGSHRVPPRSCDNDLWSVEEAPIAGPIQLEEGMINNIPGVPVERS